MDNANRQRALLRNMPVGLIVLAAWLHVSASAAEIDAVRHDPSQPKAGQAVRVTVRLAAGVAQPVLKLQAVAPGKYIRKSDAEYERDWTDIPLRDDGQAGDERAGDRIFSALAPAAMQQHRWLIRYRITAQNSVGEPLRTPDKIASCPNFAWYCDNGPAAWSGSRHPGQAPAATFPAEFLRTLQALTLIARAEDVARSQWDGGYHKQKQHGALVYRGVVYDHILYSNRGQGSAHIAGKNKWGLKFNQGIDLPLVDHDGRPFPAPLDSLNLNPGGSTPYLPVHRGIAGLDEVLSMRAYRLAGVPSPPATWVQWRVVASAEEADPRDQYAGDLWGLYVALGDMDTKLLADPALPGGQTGSIQSGFKHVPDKMQNAQALWDQFIGGARSSPPEDWWRKNLNLPAYYSFHALNRLLGNVDLRPDGNHGYYRGPDGRWAPIPWDNDMMFVPRHHQPGYIDAVNCLRHERLALEYRNRAREILDLFASDASPQGGQVGQLAADLGAALTPPGFAVNWPRLDEARWNFHPRINPQGGYFVNPAEADHFGGRWKRTLATADFAGFQKYVVDFCTDSRPTKNYAPNDGDARGYGFGYLAHEAKDEQIPGTPQVSRLGAASRFAATAFRSSAGHPAAALEWRVGRIRDRGRYELVDHWRTELATGLEVEVPMPALRERGVYRIRARWRDATGRCSHWSSPLELAVN